VVEVYIFVVAVFVVVWKSERFWQSKLFEEKTFDDKFFSSSRLKFWQFKNNNKNKPGNDKINLFSAPINSISQ
jgi:hypothetical protein